MLLLSCDFSCRVKGKWHGVAAALDLARSLSTVQLAHQEKSKC